MSLLALSTLLLLQVPPETAIDPQHDALFFSFDRADVSLTVLDAAAGQAEIARAEGTPAEVTRFVTLGYDVTEIRRSGASSGAGGGAGGWADNRLFFDLGGETLVITFSASPDAAAEDTTATPEERVSAARSRLRDLVKPGDAAGTVADGITIYLGDLRLNDAAMMFTPHMPPGQTIRIEPGTEVTFLRLVM
ncbi:MAG: hypothetical protein AAFQ75_12285, partial [Pseudomonadota bacterium]